MAIGNPTVTGWSSFWQQTGDMKAYAPLGQLAPTTGFLGWRSKLEWQIAKLFSKQQMREQKALLFGLIGATAGSNVTATYARVKAATNPSAASPTPTNVGDLGGLVPIETITVINRNTAANDVTYLKSMVNNDMIMRSLNLTVDASGNGANSRPSMLGF